MTDKSGRLRSGTLIAVAVLILGAVLRVSFLDSDPVYHQWAGYVTDEGRWTSAARGWALFGSADLSGPWAAVHLVMAPAYQAIVAVFFKALGVSFFSARLVSALSGLLLMVAALILLRGRLSKAGLLLVLLSLAAQPDLLFFSRIAIPEMTALFFEFLAFACIISRPASSARALGAGLLTVVALSVKATVAPIAAVLVMVILASHPDRAWRTRLRAVPLYLLPLAVAAVGAGAAALVLRGPGVEVGTLVPNILDFVDLVSPYSALRAPFRAPHGQAILVFVLPAWVIAGLFITWGGLPRHPARDVYVGSAIWALTLLFVATVLGYYPHRYLFHVLVPLIVHLGAGITLLQVRGWEGLASLGESWRGTRGAVAALWFAAPMAVLLSPYVQTGLVWMGLPVERFRAYLLLIALLGAGGAVLLQRRQDGGLRFALAVAPGLVAGMWFLASYAAAFRVSFFIPEEADGRVKLAVLLLGVAVAGLGYRRTGRGDSGWGTTLAVYPVLIASMWLVQIAPRYVAPTYTMREASQAVGTLAGDAPLVGTAAAGSVFLGNGLRYTDNMERRPLPDLIVWFSYDELPEFAESFEAVETFELNLGHRVLALQEYLDPTVTVYRRER